MTKFENARSFRLANMSVLTGMRWRLSVLMLMTQVASAQMSLQHSVTGVGGSSSHVSIGVRSYLVRQSIGQGSVVGLIHGDEFSIRQGFLHPVTLINNISSEYRISFKVYPNPFYDHVIVEIPESVNGDATLILTDVLGRVVYSGLLSRKLNSFHPGQLPPGQYVLRIITGHQVQTVKLTRN